MAGCDDTRQLTEAQRQAAVAAARTGVQQAVRPFTGKPTGENIADYINRELFPAVKTTRAKVNDVYLQVADNAPSGNPLQFYFSTDTANADPTTGRVRLNASPQNTATTLRISELNGRLVDVAPWLDVMAGGATTPLGVVTLTDLVNPSRFIRFDLTSMSDLGSYWNLVVSPVESSHTDPFVDGGAVAVAFIPGVGGNTPATVPLGSLSPIAQSRFIGRAEGAGTGAPTALTPTEAIAIVDAESPTWTGNHTFSGQILLGTSQVVSSAPPLNITLGANVTRLFLTSGTAGELQTISGSVAGRVVYVQNVFGSKTVKHSTGTTSALVCPNNADFSVIPRDTFWLIGDGSNGWLVSNTPGQLRRLPGAPLYDVMAPPFNAAGDGSTDDTTAINAAIAAANTTPGVIYLGPAHKVTAALTAITGHNILVVGRGEFNGGTKITVDSAAAIDLFTFSACQYGGIVGVWITSARIYSSGWAVVVSGTIHFRMHRVRIQEVCFGVKIENALLTYIDQCEISDISGNRGFLAQGTGGGFNHEAIFHRCTVGTQYPGDIIGTPAAWATGHAYIVGNVVYANGNIYQCVQNGTSSGAGSGPSGIPGTTPATAHTTQITDNTVRWVYAMGLFVGFYHGSFAHTFQLNNCTVLQGGYGLVVEDSAPGAGSLPQFTRAVNFQCDHTLLRGVQLLGGHKARFHHTFITSILAGTGIEVSSTFGGDWEFVGGEVFGCSQAGVIVNCGDGELADLQIGACGGISSNTRDCIEVGNSASDWTVTGCSGGVMFTAATDTRYGISIAAGCDNYLVEDNRFLGNVTGPILNTPGQATTRMVRNNIPEEAVTYSAAQTFASQILLGTSQVLSSAPPHTVTLNADATRLFFTTGTPGTLQTVSGSTAGRVVYVQPVFAALTVQHTAAGVGSIVCPGNVSFVCRVRDGFFLIGDGASNGWLVAGAPVGLVFDGDKGDITVSASGATWTVDNDVVTNAKAANMAQSTIKGRASGAGTGDPTDLTATQVATILAASLTGRLIARTYYLTGSGTHTYNAATTRAIVRMKGGGGAGGGTISSGVAAGSAGGGGGAAGADLELDITSVPASSAYAVGAGGTGVTAGSGNSGGDTTFHDGSATRTAPGGSGGAPLTYGTTSNTTQGGGSTAPSSSTFSTWLASGAKGSPAFTFSLDAANFGQGGHGGVGFNGTGNGYGRASAEGDGNGGTADGPGGGGGGAYGDNTTTQYKGGDGKAGIIVVEEYS